MNKFKVCALILMVSLMVFACGSANTPEGVAKTFLGHLANMDFKAAGTLATDEGRQMLSMLEGLMASASKEDLAKQKGKGDLKINDTKLNGDAATVKYTMDGKDGELEMKKVKGDWKVDFKKSMD